MCDPTAGPAATNAQPDAPRWHLGPEDRNDWKRKERAVYAALAAIALDVVAFSIAPATDGFVALTPAALAIGFAAVAVHQAGKAGSTVGGVLAVLLLIATILAFLVLYVVLEVAENFTL